ncbi:hypothetical protein GQ43DRAFT_473113 [Delitschia confertaspora ATCC 74209]|uniref:RRM domain-containing protein n=1 Tax=Delitschia confertaspora ATCC 74209 TaxID=1513339 RepID=A0A9P4MUE3_9PLEO|nr:hypothetical protein GQ43DRAFT_473113 [Delitschia confertaspora ATCC 74209]
MAHAYLRALSKSPTRPIVSQDDNLSFKSEDRLEQMRARMGLSVSPSPNICASTPPMPVTSPALRLQDTIKHNSGTQNVQTGSVRKQLVAKLGSLNSPSKWNAEEGSSFPSAPVASTPTLLPFTSSTIMNGATNGLDSAALRVEVGSTSIQGGSSVCISSQEHGAPDIDLKMPDEKFMEYFVGMCLITSGIDLQPLFGWTRALFGPNLSAECSPNSSVNDSDILYGNVLGLNSPGSSTPSGSPPDTLDDNAPNDNTQDCSNPDGSALGKSHPVLEVDEETKELWERWEEENEKAIQDCIKEEKAHQEREDERAWSPRRIILTNVAAGAEAEDIVEAYRGLQIVRIRFVDGRTRVARTQTAHVDFATRTLAQIAASIKVATIFGLVVEARLAVDH